ncbi:MAG: 16S rRNA (guanine(966)-N(2))-methyltransferase RsmD [Clostridia bacterium]
MRVISGTARGLKLISPEGLDTRPTLDRVKEALFSMLTPYIRGAAVLDLFAGSGALGIEALSRGAERSVFVDNSRAAEAAVRTNLEKSRLAEKSRFVFRNALDYLSGCGDSFSLIFMDPPYLGGLYEKALLLIAEKDVLSKDGIIAVEWDDGVGEPAFPDCYIREKERRYGRVHITLLRRNS